MPVTSKVVKLSFIPGRLKRIILFGGEHRLQMPSGELHPGRICRHIIEFILDLRADPDIQKYLDKHGGTFLDLILRAVKRYVSNHGGG